MKQKWRNHGIARETSDSKTKCTMDYDNLKDPRILYGEDVKRDHFITSLYNDASAHPSEFERSRVILRCVRNKIDPELYTITGPTWSGHFHRISIFAATPLKYVVAGKQDRVALDYGWAELTPRNNEIALGRWEHVYVPTLYQVSLQQGEFRGGSTKIMVPSDGKGGPVHEAIRGFFSMESSKLKSVELEPSLLIVYDAAFTLRRLEEAGIDTSDWELGTSSLLCEPYRFPVGMPSSKEEEVVPEKVRSRSRSPDRKYSRDRDESGSPLGHSQRRRPLPTKRRLAPMYVLDMASLWAATPRFVYPVPELKELAQTLGIVCDATEFCAGNDVMTIRDIWLALSGGPAIDERSEEIGNCNPPSTNHQEHETSQSEGDDDAIGVPGAVERLNPDEADNDMAALDNPLARYEADDDDW